MRYLYSLGIIFLGITPSIYAQSNLLESVKRNPEEAIAMCNQFKTLNEKGLSAGSKDSINKLSIQKNLSPTDAEILSIYVIGMYCPEIK